MLKVIDTVRIANLGVFNWNNVRVWSHIGHDANKLIHLFSQVLGKPYGAYPWHPSRLRHLQELRSLAYTKATPEQAELLGKYRSEANHDAVEDCYSQIKVVKLAWNILGMNKK